MEVTSYISHTLESDFDVNLSCCTVQNVLQLLDQDLTIPFIARYRRTQTNNLDAEKLRLVQQCYEDFKKLQNKIEAITKKIANDVSKEYLQEIKSAKTLEEVEEMYAPFKKGGKTLAERARKLGLQHAVAEIMNPQNKKVCLEKYINNNVEGLETVELVKFGIQNIIADEIARDIKIYEKLRNEIEPNSVFLTTKKTVKGVDHNQKYQIYYDFNRCTNYLKSYQVLAINRAEKEKIISVVLQIHERCRQNFIHWIEEKWIPRNINTENSALIVKAIEDGYRRLIEKKFFRKIRRKLTKMAEHDAIDIFSSNLKHLLLVAPVKNKTVMSIDPGFNNGCKVAVLDKHGNLQETAIIFPFNYKWRLKAEEKLIELATMHRIDLVAIGNGTACRETEKVISDMIQSKKLSLSYCIVDESGASVYSVTPEAKKEFGDLDPNLVSSVSIGRRLQDPLLELTKIEPKHLGVGMYQHDVDPKQLHAMLLHTIDDCVNFVGVDLNACSAHLLKRIAGIGEKQAKAIIEYRNTHGCFINREELLEVKGIGKVTYNNCAGFVRITPSTNVQAKHETEVDYLKEMGSMKRKSAITAASSHSKKRKRNNMNYQPEILDQTSIHPESYLVTMNVLEKLEATKEMLGTPQIKMIIDKKIRCTKEMEAFASNVCTDVHTLRIILDALKQSPNYDVREEFEKPIFKAELTSIEQLKMGMKVTGSVRNVTSFGTFVDVGVKNNGLIHNNENKLNIQLGPGDRVECTIKNIDINRGRIGLSLEKKVTKELHLF